MRRGRGGEAVARTEPFDQHAAEYDRWFADHEDTYRSELEAVRALLPEHSAALEVGVGTGRFAGPLGVRRGIEPSGPMRERARARGIDVVDAVAEDLPFEDGAFDLVLMVTTVCFLDDMEGAFREGHRVLVPGGYVLVGFLDRATPLGRQYHARRRESAFYRSARFRSSSEVLDALTGAGFGELTTVQTVFNGSTDAPEIREGHGAGLFVVVRGRS